MAQTKVKLISDGVIVQSNLHPSHGITTADIGENASYLYYTDARVSSYLSTNGYATQTDIVAAITDSAPVTLDTLNELAAALGDDPNFATTTATSLGLKAPLASPSFTGNVGIGESSPLGKLHVKTSDTGVTTPSAQGNLLVLEDSENGLSILSSTAGAGYINFGDSDDNNIGMIIYGHSSNSMDFWTNAGKRMTIDNAGNVGIGVTSTPSTKLHLGGTAPGDSIIRQDSTASGTNWEIGERAAGKWQIFEDDTDSVVATFMSIGRVGIGNPSPTYQLDVLGSGGNGGIIHVKNTDAQQYPRLAIQSDVKGYHIGVGGSGAAAVYKNNLYFYDNNVAAMRMVIDTSGKVGIGDTSPAEKLTIDGTVSGAYVRISNAASGDVSSGYMIYNGSNLDFNVYTNPTFGNTTLLTREALAIRAGGSQRMLIDSSGDVGIGVIDGDIFGRFYGRSVGIGGGAICKLQLDGTSYSGIDLGKGGTRYAEINASDAGLDLSSLGATTLKMYTNGTERMRITSSGQLGVNTTTFAPTITNQIKLGNMGSGVVGEVFDANVVDGAARMILAAGGSTGQVPIISLRHYSAAYGLDIWMYYSSPWNTYFDNRHPNSGFIFRNNCNADGSEDELMRIESSGRVQIQKAAPGSALLVSSNDSSGAYGINIHTPNYTGTATWGIYLENGSEVKMITYMSGTIDNRTGVYGTISDGRLKENIVDATPKLDDLMKLKIRNFNFITSEDKHIGLIAQEVEEVFPNLVSDRPDKGEDEEGNIIELETSTKTVKSSLFVPMLIKAMQEQQVMLEELKAEIETLKTQING